MATRSMLAGTSTVLPAESVNCTVSLDADALELAAVDALADALDAFVELDIDEPHPAIPNTTAKHNANIAAAASFRVPFDAVDFFIIPSSLQFVYLRNSLFCFVNILILILFSVYCYSEIFIIMILLNVVETQVVLIAVF